METRRSISTAASHRVLVRHALMQRDRLGDLMACRIKGLSDVIGS